VPPTDTTSTTVPTVDTTSTTVLTVDTTSTTVPPTDAAAQSRTGGARATLASESTVTS
jgi:hypothetical protein